MGHLVCGCHADDADDSRSVGVECTRYPADDRCDALPISDSRESFYSHDGADSRNGARSDDHAADHTNHFAAATTSSTTTPTTSPTTPTTAPSTGGVSF